MKRRNGFTFAELLGVITILGLLALLVIPSVDKMIKDSNETLYQTQLSTIIDGAKTWSSDHVVDLPVDGKSITVTLETLKLGGYVAVDIKNPKTDEPFPDTLIVRITEHNSQYQYKVED